jgi:glycosyltransferase involved in cell wall biosynthesis
MEQFRQRIKVMHIITRLDMGGSAQNTLATCRHLDYTRYEVLLLHGPTTESRMTSREASLVQENVEHARQAGLRVICLPKLVRRIDPLQDLQSLVAMLKFIRREKPVIVHTHTSKAGLLGRLAARMCGVPVIIHTPHGHVFYGHFGPVVSKLFLVFEKVAARWTDRLVALTETERHDHIRFGVSKPENTLTIHSGVDLSRYFQRSSASNGKRKELGLLPDDRVIGTVGWLLPIKGPQVLLEAVFRLHQKGYPVKALFVGKGSLAESLQRQVIQHELSERVTFLGWRDDIPNIMPVFDIFVLASLNEGMGRVLVEAMAAGRPVVASRTGGIPDLIRDGENGLLVPPGDASALAEALGYLIDNPGPARRMGRRGRDLCRQFSLERMVEHIDGLYCEMASSCRTRRQ